LFLVSDSGTITCTERKEKEREIHSYNEWEWQLSKKLTVGGAWGSY